MPQGLALLHRQRVTGRPCREFALHRGEESFDKGPTLVELARKRSAHLGAHTVDTPSFFSALGGNHALCAESLPDVGVIPLAVELGVG